MSWEGWDVDSTTVPSSELAYNSQEGEETERMNARTHNERLGNSKLVGDLLLRTLFQRRKHSRQDYEWSLLPTNCVIPCVSSTRIHLTLNFIHLLPRRVSLLLKEPLSCLTLLLDIHAPSFSLHYPEYCSEDYSEHWRIQDDRCSLGSDWETVFFTRIFAEYLASISLVKSSLILFWQQTCLLFIPPFDVCPSTLSFPATDT